MAEAGFRLPDASYETLHKRLFYERGRAADQACQDCDRQAHDWAYDHSDPDERHDGRGRPYSLDTARYVSLCVPCHRARDAKSVCRKGHSWTPANTYINRDGVRFCRTCRRLYMRTLRKGISNG